MGGKTQASSSSVSIPPEVLARYNSVNAQAQSVAQTPFQQYSSDPNAFVAPLTAAQNAGLQGTANYANAAQPGIAQAQTDTQASMAAANPSALDGAAISQYMSPFQNAVVNTTGQLMQQQYGTAMSGQLGNAVSSGAFGGDRSGIAAANLQQQQSLAYGQTMSGLENQNYSQALQTAQQQQGVQLSAQQANLQRMQAGAAQEGQLATAGQTAGLAGAQAEMSAGQQQQQTQQAGQTALYNQFLQQQSYPFQTTQFLANIAEGTGALSGQTTNTTSSAPFFSDRRLKENIKEVGKAKNGLPIYTFNYKGDPEKLTRMGFMAQDVEKKNPDAVGLAGGYKTVDYERAARAVGGGLVGGRGHFDAGGFANTTGYDPTWSAQMRAEEGMFGPNAGGLYGATGPVSDTPRGGKSYVPAQQVPQHHQLPAAPQPPHQQDSGLKQVGQLAGEAKQLMSLGSMAKDGAAKLPGLAGGTAAPAVAAAPAADVAPAQPTAAPADGGHPAAQPTTDAPHADAGASSGAGTDVADAGDGLSGGVANASMDTGSDMSGLSDLGDMFAARGGAIHRSFGGGLAGAMGVAGVGGATGAGTSGGAGANPMADPATYAYLGEQLRQNGGLARGGAAGHFADGGAPVAPANGAPDVVSPNAEYLRGLGEAQDAQVRATQVQNQERQNLVNLGITTSPDLTPAGQALDASAINGALNAGYDGGPTPGYSGSTSYGPVYGFASGGLAGRQHFDAGGAGSTNSSGGSDAGDPEGLYDAAGGIDIPNQSPDAKLPNPPQPPNSSGGSGGRSALGAATSILGLFLADGGLAGPKKRKKRARR